ncbi:MAG: glycosyltransferase family 39 protein [bacterium]|nr:glycosyltransferase family 39 protein [bacterium]
MPLGATLLAAACILHDIGEKSLWFDEGLSVYFARAPADELWRIVRTREINAGLYYLLLRLWLHCGDSEAWVRGLAGAAVIATVPVLWGLGRRLLGRVAAGAAAILFATHPLAVQYGQEARTYGVVMLAVTLATLALVRGLDGGRPAAWAAWAGALVVGLYLHFFAALVGVAHGVAILLRGPSRVPWRYVAPAAALIVVAALPLIGFVLTQDAGQIDWLRPPTAGDVRWVLLGFSGYGETLGLALAALAWLLGAAGVFYGTRRWETALVVAWATLPPLLAWLVSFRKPVFLDRYLLVALPAATLLAGAGVARLGAWPLCGALLAALLAVQAQGLERLWKHMPKEDWRGAARVIAAGAQPGDVYTCWTAPGCATLAYYLARQPAGVRPRQVLIVDELAAVGASPPVAGRVAALAAEPRVWLVTSHVRVGRADRGSDLDALEARLGATGHVRERQWPGRGVGVSLWSAPAP